MEQIAGIGIDLGGTATKVGAVDARTGKMLLRTQIPTADVGGQPFADCLVQAIERMVAQLGLAPNKVAGAGFAMPGSVVGGSVPLDCVNVPVPVSEAVAAVGRLMPSVPVALLNDANAAALGESWCGAARDARSSITVTLGTGVGCGVVLDGWPYAGAHGAAGELGHLCVEPNEGRPCRCGASGCLEQYAAAPGMVERARELLAQPGTANSILSASTDLGARELFDAAQVHDGVACIVVAEFVDHLGFGLAQAACLYDPAIIVLGGGMSASADCWLDGVRVAFACRAYPALADTPVVVAELGNDAGVVGAVRFACAPSDKAAPAVNRK